MNHDMYCMECLGLMGECKDVECIAPHTHEAFDLCGACQGFYDHPGTDDPRALEGMGNPFPGYDTPSLEEIYPEEFFTERDY